MRQKTERKKYIQKGETGKYHNVYLQKFPVQARKTFTLLPAGSERNCKGIFRQREEKNQHPDFLRKWYSAERA
jgi:hypothetical protein